MAKIKIKTNKGAKKRFKVTGSGKITHFRANKSHILTTKGRKRKRRLRHNSVVLSADVLNIKKLLPCER